MTALEIVGAFSGLFVVGLVLVGLGVGLAVTVARMRRRRFDPPVDGVAADPGIGLAFGPPPDARAQVTAPPARPPRKAFIFEGVNGYVVQIDVGTNEPPTTYVAEDGDDVAAILARYFFMVLELPSPRHRDG